MIGLTSHHSTLPGAGQCVEQRFDDATLSTYITGWGCASVATVVTAYDRYSVDGGGVTTVTDIRSSIPAPTSESVITSGSSSTPTGPISSSNSPSSSPVAPPVTPSTPSPSSSSLSGGAIAGIAIGAVIAIAIIAGLIALLYIQRRNRSNHQQLPPPPSAAPMVQTVPNPPPGSPPLTNAHTSYMSNPSATSTTPLTQNNVAAISQTPSEVRPQDSASNIGGYSGSVISPGSPTHPSSSGSPEHSGLAPLPRPQYPTGPAAFPNQNAPSVLSPGSDFGSMPPGMHAPTVTSYR